MSVSRAVAGRTLIELLVALALGLLILSGVAAVYYSSNQSGRFAASAATAEESGQLALRLIGEAIRRAGYSEIIGADVTGTAIGRQSLLYSGPLVRGCQVGRFNDPANGDFSCTGMAGGDALAVWFQADSRLAPPQGATPDCLGSAAPLVAVADPQYAARVAGGQIPLVQNVYFVQGQALMCLGNGSAAAQPLVEGVEDFKVYFGFDDEAYATAAGNAWQRPSARRMMTAGEIMALPAVGAFEPWEFVVAVHVCLLVATPEAGISSAGADATFRPCPQTAVEAASEVAPVPLPADGRLRRSYRATFALRSRAAANALNL